MAESYGLSSKPPTATPDSKRGPGITTGDLARSNGVIKPPPVTDRSVIAPPANADPGMQTVPDTTAAPKVPNFGGETPNGAIERGARAGRDRTALQAALTAARDSAERGDEQACQESLAKARQIAERPSSGD